MRRLAVITVTAISLFTLFACGEEEEHAALTAELVVTPSPATVGAAVEFELEILEGTEERTAKEVHLEMTRNSTMTPISVEMMQDGHHHKGMHSFTEAGTYMIEVEAHVDGGDGHEEEVKTSAQLVVQ